jgi:hypothetical protein
MITHPDILKFLSFEDAVKLRLTNKSMLKECTEMKWNDCESKITNFEKWYKCFPNSCGFLLQTSYYTHEKTDLHVLSKDTKLCSLLSSLHVESLCIPAAKHFVSWPLDIFDHVKELSMNVTKKVIAVLEQNKMSKSLVRVTCLSGSKLMDTDILECSFDQDGCLLVTSNFWNSFPLLENFDCSATSLSHAILDSCIFSSNKRLKVLIVNHFFNLQSNESKRAVRMGVTIWKKGAKKERRTHQENVQTRKSECEESETEL